MANIAVNNIYKHRVYCYCGNQEAINTRYFQIAAITGAVPSEQSFANSLDTAMQALYLPLLHSQAQYIGNDIQNITGTRPYPTQLGTSSHSASGTATGTPIPSAVCGMISVYCALVGKGYRGRSYIPFPPSSAVTTTGTPGPSAGYLANLTLLAVATFGSTTIPVGASFVNVQWGLLKHPISPTVNVLAYTVSCQLPARFGTQHRRGSYGKQNPVPTP